MEAPKPKPKKVYNIPPYGQRENYVPRCREDYGDGGAFPEIHITQYPLDMGRSELAGETKVVSVAVDEEGNADYDRNLLNQGRSTSMVIHSKISTLVGAVGDRDLSRPSEEEVAALTLKTREALEKKIQRKILEVGVWETFERSPWTIRRSTTFPSARTSTSSRR